MSMEKELLLEIGTEEIPAHVMPGILKALAANAEKALKEHRIAYRAVRTVGTPRRLALIASGLADRQADENRESRGPSVKIAFDADGNPTKAAQGFARGQGIDPKDLVVKDDYVYAMVHAEGTATAELLKEILPALITGLSFPNTMRWGTLDFKFIRPIRWLVALYGDEVIPFELANVKSGRISRGHRFLSSGDFEIARAADYEKACEEAYIIVDPERRKKLIIQGIEKVAEENGGKAEITEDLLEEVLYLVEYPTALCGSFDKKYLELPPEAVITPMRDHQRYFPVKDAAGKLLPLFITVRNGGSEYLDVVQHGNERVLRARLDDAQFFFDEDRKKSLETHREKLKTVVFQQGLGTMYEKTERMAKLSEIIARTLGMEKDTVAAAKEAALLSKADLTTGMVQEFTELQGIMGRAYAKLDGKSDAIAAAIDEHYKPRFAGDTQPSTDTGRIVSLADKIDTIVGTFSLGKIPTGSEDPFALRRQALGLVNTIIEAKYSLSLSSLIDSVMDAYSMTDDTERRKMQKDVCDFIRLRLKNVLEDIRYDIADAVLEEIDDIYSVKLRAEALSSFFRDSDPKKGMNALTRVHNLAQKTPKDTSVDSAHFTLDAEHNLYEAFEDVRGDVTTKASVHEYQGALHSLMALAPSINAFFDDVMVMDKDENIRNNRLGLLKAIDTLALSLADFSKIVTQ